MKDRIKKMMQMFSDWLIKKFDLKRANVSFNVESVRVYDTRNMKVVPIHVSQSISRYDYNQLTILKVRREMIEQLIEKLYNDKNIIITTVHNVDGTYNLVMTLKIAVEK